MNDGRHRSETSSSESVHRSPKKSYNFLLRLSGKMGAIATRSFVEVRHFLNTEIPMPQKDRLLEGMSYLKHRTEVELGDQSTEKIFSRFTSGRDLKKIVKQSHEVLASANTVFPVSLFPDTVVVDRTKVTITRRNFFWSSDVMSIRIEDVLNVSASVGPLFGSLTVASRVMSTIDHFQISFFWRNDAIHLKHIIQGYVIAQHNNLDTAHLHREELVKTLEELGQDFNV